MPTTREDQNFAQQSATVFHPISTADETAMAARRTIVEPHKGGLRGTAARAPFDAIMEHVAVPEGVVFEAGVVGGVPGWWSKPEGVQPLDAGAATNRLIPLATLYPNYRRAANPNRRTD